jgi:hypothetical protein
MDSVAAGKTRVGEDIIWLVSQNASWIALCRYRNIIETSLKWFKPYNLFLWGMIL